MNKEVCRDFRHRLPALAENPLGPEAQPALLDHIRQCPACSAEYQWLTGLCRELEAMGDAADRAARPVDLTNDVLNAVARLKQPRLLEPAPARTPRRRFSQAWWLAASAAAAAAIVAAVWLAGYQVTRPVTPSMAGGAGVAPAEPAAGNSKPFEMAGNGQTAPIPAGVTPFEKLIADMRPGAGSPGETDSAALASLSIRDILTARKNAVNNPAAKLQLAQWAELSAERARQLAADQNAPMGARIGAAGSLSTEEAEKILLAAVAADPNNPYLRQQLGNLYGADPETAAKAAQEFSAQAELDPDNALAYYQLAASLFAQGDAEGALSALQAAHSLTGADPYTFDAANYQRQALEQSGVGEDVARLLVALTAGTSQYGDLTALGNQLLEYGKYYEQTGQTELAEQIFNSVRLFGEQLAGNASFTNELLAGLDIQREAVTALSGLVDFMQQPENADLLARSGQQLVGALNVIGGLFTSLNEFFQQDLGADILDAFVDFVLQNGDLGALDFLNGAGN